MKNSYKQVVKESSRTALREFIQAAFTLREISIARVLCFPGREGLEVPIYCGLGVPPENIVCIEKDRCFANELKRRKQGTKIHRQTLQDFLDDPPVGQFEIISLDTMAQFASFVPALHALRGRDLIADRAILSTNFCGAREADASKGMYALAGWSGRIDSAVVCAFKLFRALCREGISVEDADALRDALRWLFSGNPAIPVNRGVLQRRSEAIHSGIRRIMTSPANSLVHILFRECDRDGSLTREAQKFLQPDFSRSIPEIATEAAAVFRQQLAMILKQPGFMPPKVAAMLEARVAKQIRELVERFARECSARAGNWDIEQTSELLVRAIDSFIGGERFVVTARSCKYVGEGGTPMYADMLLTRRIADFDELGRILPSGPTTLDELLKPIEELGASGFNSLINSLEYGSTNLRRGEAQIPTRQHLGCESRIRPRVPYVTLDPASRKTQALQLMSQNPSLTIEDIAHSVGAKSSQEIAAVKAHWTMGTYSGSVEDLEACADREFAAGRFQSAQEIIKRLRRRSRKSVRLLTKLAKCLDRLGKPRQGLTAIRRALEIEPSNIEGLLLAGDMHRRAGQYEKAQQAFEEVLQVERWSVSAFVGRGEALLGQEKIADAWGSFEGALQIDRSCLAAKFGRANCLDALRGSRAALAAFCDPELEKANDARVWYNRGILRIHLNRRRKAIDDLSRAVEEDPQFFLAWFNLGYLFFEEENMLEAHRAYSRAAAVRPGDIDTHWFLSTVCYRLGRLEESYAITKWLDKNAPAVLNKKAHAALERALQLVPFTFESLMRRAQALFDQEMYRASIRMFRHVLKLAPQYPEARIGRAAALSRLKLFDEALDDLYYIQERIPEEVPGISDQIEQMHACAALAKHERSIHWLRIVQERSGK
ncbi:tetratricopeptide repeat protein [Steroidobacter sp. S1-65]|uniref:Tetratricopeptide repeat protein n=1 Tax=Steroidobacter gossypii TaxID=2805490 RepID=A0ABS1WQE3_9GAMM|nr:tetratricopeptide repeat protein [Steroidobacter gossypii]MBM0103200.1 tetratricopeptide repeat protein [Steroidobacter gossypii]